MADGKGFLPAPRFCFVFCMLICQWTSLILRAVHWHHYVNWKFLSCIFGDFFLKGICRWSGECAIQKLLINVIFELVPSLTFWGLPTLKPFFLWLCFLTFHTFQRRKGTVRSGAEDLLLKQDYLLPAQRATSGPPCPQLRKTLCSAQCLKLTEQLWPLWRTTLEECVRMPLIH